MQLHDRGRLRNDQYKTTANLPARKEVIPRREKEISECVAQEIRARGAAIHIFKDSDIFIGRKG